MKTNNSNSILLYIAYPFSRRLQTRVRCSPKQFTPVQSRCTFRTHTHTREHAILILYATYVRVYQSYAIVS